MGKMFFISMFKYFASWGKCYSFKIEFTLQTNRQVCFIHDTIPTRSTWKRPKVAHSDIFHVQNTIQPQYIGFFPPRIWLQLNFYSWLPTTLFFVVQSCHERVPTTEKEKKIHLFWMSNWKKKKPLVENWSHTSSSSLHEALPSAINSQN